MFSKRLSFLCMAALAVLTCAMPATAQTRVRGTITKVDGLVLTVKTHSGSDVTVRLAEKTNVAIVTKASIDDIKTDSYIGAAAMPEADGTLKALEIHIFPPAMRGVGEGSRDFDLQPGSTMTNAAVTGSVVGTNGPTLTLTYPNGSKTVVIPAGTPIVAMGAGTLADVKPGVGTVIFGDSKEADGTVDTKRIVVGKDGVNPPM